MKNFRNIFLKTAAAALAVTLAAGCVFEKEGPSALTKDVMVLLDVSTSDMHTKAVIDGGNEDPTDAEKKISTVRIYAFDSTGKQIGYADNDNKNDGKFHMVLQVPEGAATMTADFYVVANEGAMFYNNSAVTLSEQMTVKDLKDIRYSSLMQNTTDLPMYGIVNNYELKLTQGTQHLENNGGHPAGFLLTQTLNIELTRDLAKIGVYAVGDADALTETAGPEDRPRILSVTLNAAGRRNYSYLLPADDDAALKSRDADNPSLGEKRVFTTDMLTNGGVLAETLTKEQFAVPATLLDKDWAPKAMILAPFYLAEVPYGSNAWNTPADPAGRPVVLTLEYALNKNDVEKYVDVNMPAIQRNHFYKVFCFIKSEGTITLKIHVLDWETGDEWVLEFDLPTATNPVPASSSFVDGAYQHHVQAPATMYYTFYTDENDNPIPTDAGAFSVDFRMTQPVGQSWTPTLNAASSRYFAINVYERKSGNKVTTPSIEASEDIVYTIKVYPLNPLSPMNPTQVAFSITYTPSWQGGSASYFLPINGTSATNLAWTEYGWTSGDYDANGDGVAPSTETIVITQIESPSAANN